jgi:hypothetical protein
MEELRKPTRGRETSERLQRRLAYNLVNKTNICIKYQKTSEEKEALKRVRSQHKKDLKAAYGEKYTRRVMNLPDHMYRITMGN